MAAWNKKLFKPKWLTSLFISTKLFSSSPKLRANAGPRAVPTTCWPPDESAQQSCQSRLQNQFVHHFSDGKKNVLVELGPSHLDLPRVLVQVADSYRLSIVYLDEPPQVIQDLQPALFLQTFEDCVFQVVRARLASNLRTHMRFSQGPLGEARARNTFASLGFVLSCTTNSLFGSLQLYRPLHAAHHPLQCFSLTYYCHCAPLKPTDCELVSRQKTSASSIQLFVALQDSWHGHANQPERSGQSSFTHRFHSSVPDAFEALRPTVHPVTQRARC